jgi:ABC-type phosphate transport system substrate-binding protein
MTASQGKRRAFLATAGFVALVARFALGGDPAGYLVIVHPNNPVTDLDRTFLRDAFLKRKPVWSNNETIRPVDLSADFPAREQFSREVLKRGVAEVKNYWYQQIFSGKGVPPPELDSEAAVIAYVIRNIGAIGYVSASRNPAGAKVVAVK